MKTKKTLFVAPLAIVVLLFAAQAHAAPASSVICEVGGKLVVRSKCSTAAVRIARRVDLTGPQGPKGDTGSPGPVSSTLPSGVTLRGFYAANGYAGSLVGGNAIFYATVSYGFSLSSAPTAHYIAYNQAPPPECPGTVEQPEAAAGHLCVYENGRMNVATATVATTAGENIAANFGAIISTTPTTMGMLEVNGTWAVTAP